MGCVRWAQLELLFLLLHQLLMSQITHLPYAADAPPVGVVGESNCSCDSFCTGGCSPFATTQTSSARGPRLPNYKPTNLTLFRFTPRSQRQLGDTNTGDAVGDLAFLLDRRALSVRCAVEPTNERCFLAPWTDMAFGRWTISTDLSRLGPYLACNPQYTSPDLSHWNVSNFTCSEDCVTPPYCPDPSLRRNDTSGGDGQLTCYCDRATWTVGAMPLTGNAPGADAVTRHAIHASKRAVQPPASSNLPQLCYYGFNRNISLPGSGLCVVPATSARTAGGPGFVYRNISGSNESSLLSICCDTCSSVAQCKGFNVVQEVSGDDSHYFTCQLFTGQVAIAQSALPSVCQYAALRDPLPGGSWNWGCNGDESGLGVWYSTPQIGQCAEGSPVLSHQPCSWTLVGDAVFVNSTCVLKRLDAVIEAHPTTRECMATCKSQNIFPAPRPRIQANRPECWWKCYFLAVGGGGFPSVVPFSELIEAFAASFNVTDARRGCPPA